MPTQEDRIAALERKVAMLELLRSQDEKNWKRVSLLHKHTT
jgi:hypothetical protein